MKTTFITKMPDKAGAFLKASKIIAGAGGNIVRVSFNKAVDSHLLLIEVKCDEDSCEKIKAELNTVGYLLHEYNAGSVILMEFKLNDVPGAVTPVLEVINDYNFNISYISSQENGTPYQAFRMGLFIENTESIKSFLDRVSSFCEVKIVDYDKTEKALDNTVFYLSFANGIAEKLNLEASTRYTLICEANKIMQMLEEKGDKPYKTFEYIAAFADRIKRYSGIEYKPEVELVERNGFKIYCIQPPCGSNTFIILKDKTAFIVDGGYTCYAEDLLRLCRSLIPDFDKLEITSVITHADIDHVGLVGKLVPCVMSRSAYGNFIAERCDGADYREQNLFNAPYCRIGKALTGYIKPDLNCIKFVGNAREGDEPLEKVGSISFCGMEFEIYEGLGGHVKGETVYVCEGLKTVFCGDLLVNGEGLSDNQREFNLLAPYLMRGVNVNSALAQESRKELRVRYDKEGWLLCCGHGAFWRN